MYEFSGTVNQILLHKRKYLSLLLTFINKLQVTFFEVTK